MSIYRHIRKYKQVFFSVNRYMSELKKIRKPSNLYYWLYHKTPNLFPLAITPVFMVIELTNHCNLNCSHCWRTTMERPLGYMQKNTLNKIISQVKKIKPKLLKIGGSGEPSIHPNFTHIVNHIPGHLIPVMLFTNGQIFEKYIPKQIIEWNINTLVVSIDGVDKNSYERYRKGGNFTKLRENIAQFYKYRNNRRKKKPILEIRHTIMPGETSKQLERFKHEWLKTVDVVGFNALAPANGLLQYKDNSPPKCRQIKRELAIQWDGRVPLCGGHRNVYIGNIIDSDIKTLWMHPRLQQLRRWNRDANFDKLDICRRCCVCR